MGFKLDKVNRYRSFLVLPFQGISTLACKITAELVLPIALIDKTSHLTITYSAHQYFIDNKFGNSVAIKLRPQEEFALKEIGRAHV